jgi:hypothetical protein
MPRPRNGEWLADEIAGFRGAGIDIVVSLLEAQEVRELCLGDEPSLCEAAGMQFVSFPVADRGVPSNPAAFAPLVGALVRQLRSGARSRRTGHRRASSVGARLCARSTGTIMSAAIVRYVVAVGELGSAAGTKWPSFPRLRANQ